MKYMLFIIVVGSILLNGCEKDLDTYEGGCGIYFNNNEMLSDTVGVAWGMLPGTQKTQTLTLQVDLYGTVAPYDRSFSIEVVSAEDDTLRAEEGVDYGAFPLEYVIPANEASTEINVPLLRRENLSEKPRRFTIKLIENEELRFLYSRQMMVDSVTYRPLDFQRVIVMTEDFPQPGWWSREGQSRFGDFSQKNCSATKGALLPRSRVGKRRRKNMLARAKWRAEVRRPAATARCTHAEGRVLTFAFLLWYNNRRR